MLDQYLSEAVLGVYDGDSVTPPPAGDAGANDAAAAAAAAIQKGTLSPDGKTLFTQEQVNSILAEDKRKHQAVLAKTEQDYKTLLANSTTLTAKERETLTQNLEQVQAQLRTKEAQAQHEKKQLEEQFGGKLKEAEERATTWEGKYRESTVTRSLQDAAVQHGAYSSEQIVTILRPMTKLVEVVENGKGTGQYRPVVEFPDKNPTTGEPMMASFSPEEAVKRMQELPEKYGNLFKNNVVSGIGSNSSTGLTPGSNGRIDVRNLTPAQYREVRAKNPELLGLRPRRR